MSDINQFLETRKDKAEELIQKNKFSGLLKIFNEIINTVDNISLFYDFFSDISIRIPPFSMHKFFKAYYNDITKMLSLQQIFDLEAYALQKYCLYEDEKILASFVGHFYANGQGKPKGRFYLTNLRMIVISKLKAGRMEAAIIKKIIRALKIRLKEFRPSKLPCLGYQFPAYDINWVRLGMRKVSYNVSFKAKPGELSRKGEKNYIFVFYPHDKDKDRILTVVHNTLKKAVKT